MAGAGTVTSPVAAVPPGAEAAPLVQPGLVDVLEHPQRLVVEGAADPEVEVHDCTLGVEHQVAGVDVAVEEPVLEGRLHPRPHPALQGRLDLAEHVEGVDEGEILLDGEREAGLLGAVHEPVES